MPKICYIDKNFRDKSLELIEQANTIINTYQADGFDLTLRQLYYQFVARDIIPNSQKEYDKLGTLISNARLAGLIDWKAIEDRTRNLKELSHWDNPGQIVHAASRSYRVDHWEGQPVRPEVWVEKEALIGVVARICEDLDVGYFACKGYVSQSEMWNASQRFQDRFDETEQRTVLIHLGDHDPSGIDMTRDIADRQEVFEVFGIKVNRIALNMDQIRQYDPPPNPAKLTDSRCQKYIRDYGSASWELDALEPKVLQSLISQEVNKHIDLDILGKVLTKEREHKAILKRVEDNWETL